MFFNNMHQRKVYINKEFLSIFYPFYYVSTIWCMRKYNINNNGVGNVTRKNFVYAVIMICVMIGFYYGIMKYTKFSVKTYGSIYNIIYLEYLLNFVGVCALNLYYSTTTVRLLALLYEISKCPYSRNDTKKFKTMSCFLTVTLLLFCLILVVFKITYDPYWTLLRGVYVSTSILLDLEIIQIMLYTHILTCKTIRWNYNIKNINFGNGNDEIAVDREIVLKEMQNTMISIYDAWDLTLKTSGFSISFHFITTFVQTLVYVGVLIIWSKVHSGNYEVINSHTFGVFLWLTKVFFVELGLCLACEAFYEELGKARSNVVRKVSQDLPSKKVWKNIFRVLHKDFEKMSACGFFAVDAATLLNFCNVVATYTIVLLQFAFL